MSEDKDIVVDRQARDELYRHIIQYLAQDIDDNKLYEVLDKSSSSDPAVMAVRKALQDELLSDCDENDVRVNDEEIKQAYCRFAIFLRGELPYRWPKIPSVKIGWDLNAWPFVKTDELNAAKETLKLQSKDDPSVDTLLKLLDTDWRRVRRDKAIELLESYLEGKATADNVRRKIVLSVGETDLQNDIRLYLSGLPSTPLTSIANQSLKAQISDVIKRCVVFLTTNQQCTWESKFNRYGFDSLAIISVLSAIVMMFVATFAGFMVLCNLSIINIYFVTGLLGFAISLWAVIALLRLPITLPRKEFMKSVHNGSRKTWPFAIERGIQ